MEVYGIHPSIIIYTNLIHVSFYNRKPKKAEIAFSLFRKTKLQADALIFSKLIDGLIRFKNQKRVPKYVNYALKSRCTLKNQTINNILKIFTSNEMKNKIDTIILNKKINHGPHKFVHKTQNQFNIENPKKFKKMIKDKRLENRLKNQDKRERIEQEQN